MIDADRHGHFPEGIVCMLLVGLILFVAGLVSSVPLVAAVGAGIVAGGLVAPAVTKRVAGGRLS
ncbi:hypothetical protein [Nocardia sp. BMG111209]|uniref:hypothetical protein n=1 Tax=Nocardia sp. BMG111209 TaxID=1160137 RepID=UPI000371C34C|nr:hypothetical protein [Nocardia sp. BMG111209]